MTSYVSYHPVARLYRTIIEDVVEGCNIIFKEEGIEESVVLELKRLWEIKLLQSRTLSGFYPNNHHLLLQAHRQFLQIPTRAQMMVQNGRNSSFKRTSTTASVTSTTRNVVAPSQVSSNMTGHILAPYKQVLLVHSNGHLATLAGSQLILGQVAISPGVSPGSQTSSNPCLHWMTSDGFTGQPVTLQHLQLPQVVNQVPNAVSKPIEEHVIRVEEADEDEAPSAELSHNEKLQKSRMPGPRVPQQGENSPASGVHPVDEQEDLELPFFPDQHLGLDQSAADVLQELELAVLGSVANHQNTGQGQAQPFADPDFLDSLLEPQLLFQMDGFKENAEEDIGEVQALGSLPQLDGVGDPFSDNDDDDDEEEEELIGSSVEEDEVRQINEKSLMDSSSSEDSSGSVDDHAAQMLEEVLIVDEDPLNSGDDASEHDMSELFDVDHVVVCQFDKIHRSKNRWKFHFKDGIMNLNGWDYVFSKLFGEAEW
uniref:transcription initiation factor IIA subunit 1-like n=1 Tax=Myxine glutinosa TaxID=7769 RepID=UPI00358E5FB6